MSKRPKPTPSIIGERLKFARVLACLSTAEAAQKLGIRSPSRLSRAEHPIHPRGITPRLLADAAQTYGVSGDFLLGLSEDWEPRAELPFLAELEELRQRHESLHEQIFQALAREAVSLADDQLPVTSRQATAIDSAGSA